MRTTDILIQAVEAAGFSTHGPTDARAAEHGEPAWVCNARAAIANAPHVIEALRACVEELEYVRVHCRDARGGDVIAALSAARAVIATEAAPPGETGRIATGTESARQTARTGSASGGSAHPAI
jgi:hypothetical protein